MFKKIIHKLKNMIDDAKVLTQRYILSDKVKLLEEHELVGADGEQMVFDLLKYKVDYIKQGIIMIHGSKIYEKDFLVVDQGNIFIIEVKNWKGHVYYQPKSKEWIKEKQDHYTHEIYTDTFYSPLISTQNFCSRLQSSLTKQESSFSSIKFIPIIAFVSEDCDLDSSIRKLDKGILYVEELMSYIKDKTKQSLNREQFNVLKSLRTWDIVTGKNGSIQNSLIQDQYITLLDHQDQLIEISVDHIYAIDIVTSHVMFDDVIVHLTNGKSTTYKNQTSKIHLKLPGNEKNLEIIDLKQIQRITFGDKQVNH